MATPIKIRKFGPELNLVKEYFRSQEQLLAQVRERLGLPSNPAIGAPQVYELLWRMLEQMNLLQESQGLLTRRGDLLTRNTQVLMRLPVGANGQILTADSTEESGLLWTDEAAGYPPISLTSSYIMDDFLCGAGIADTLNEAGGSVGDTGWCFFDSNAGVGSLDMVGGDLYHGTLGIATGNVIGNEIMIFGPNYPTVGGGNICTELSDFFSNTFLSRWKVRPLDTASIYVMFGYSHSTTAAALGLTPSGAYFQKRVADTNWQAVIRNGGSETRVNTGVAFATTTPNSKQYRTYSIEKVTNSSWRFKISGEGDAGYNDVLDDPNGSTFNDTASKGRIFHVRTDIASSRAIYLHFFDQYMTGIEY